MQGTPRQSRKSGSGSRSDSPVGSKPVPPSSVPQSVWDNVAHKRSSSDELVLNLRTQQGGDLPQQHIQDSSAKGGSVKPQRPQSAGARTQSLQLAPEANLPIHLMSTTNEQRVGGVSTQHTHHLPMKLASHASAPKGASGGNKASRSQSLSMPNKLPMKLSSAPSGSSLEGRSAHTMPSYSSPTDSSSVAPANVPVSSPATAPASVSHHPLATAQTQQQMPNTVNTGNAVRFRPPNAQQGGTANSAHPVHQAAVVPKRTMPNTQHSVPSGGTTTPARQMHSFRSQPAMHLGAGSGVKPGGQGVPTQSILPMKLAQSGGKAKSNKQPPKSPLSPEQQKPAIPPRTYQMLSSSQSDRWSGSNSSGGAGPQHPPQNLPQTQGAQPSHSQPNPKQKPSEQEIIYF